MTGTERRLGDLVVSDDVGYGGVMNGVTIRKSDGDYGSGVYLRGEEALHDIHYALGRIIARIELEREKAKPKS